MRRAQRLTRRDSTCRNNLLGRSHLLATHKHLCLRFSPSLIPMRQGRVLGVQHSRDSLLSCRNLVHTSKYQILPVCRLFCLDFASLLALPVSVKPSPLLALPSAHHHRLARFSPSGLPLGTPPWPTQALRSRYYSTVLGGLADLSQGIAGRPCSRATEIMEFSSSHMLITHV